MIFQIFLCSDGSPEDPGLSSVSWLVQLFMARIAMYQWFPRAIPARQEALDDSRWMMTSHKCTLQHRIIHEASWNIHIASSWRNNVEQLFDSTHRGEWLNCIFTLLQVTSFFAWRLPLRTKCSRWKDSCRTGSLVNIVLFSPLIAANQLKSVADFWFYERRKDTLCPAFNIPSASGSQVKVESAGVPRILEGKA